MKNKLNILLILSLIIFATMGCGMIERFQSSSDNSNTASNKSITDRTIEEVADGETTGVKECDEAIRFMTDQMQSPDDNWVSKGVKDYAAGQFKRQIKEAIAQNQGDEKKLAQQCVDLKNSFEKNLKQEQQKQKQ